MTQDEVERLHLPTGLGRTLDPPVIACGRGPGKGSLSPPAGTVSPVTTTPDKRLKMRCDEMGGMCRIRRTKTVILFHQQNLQLLFNLLKHLKATER